MHVESTSLCCPPCRRNRTGRLYGPMPAPSDYSWRAVLGATNTFHSEGGHEADHVCLGFSPPVEQPPDPATSVDHHNHRTCPALHMIRREIWIRRRQHAATVGPLLGLDPQGNREGQS